MYRRVICLLHLFQRDDRSAEMSLYAIKRATGRINASGRNIFTFRVTRECNIVRLQGKNYIIHRCYYICPGTDNHNN